MVDHIGLRVKDLEKAKQLYTAILAPLGHVPGAAGAKDNGAPGLRTDYAPNYYAAFLLDADGNNVEAVCMR